MLPHTIEKINKDRSITPQRSRPSFHNGSMNLHPIYHPRELRNTGHIVSSTQNLLSCGRSTFTTPFRREHPQQQIDNRVQLKIKQRFHQQLQRQNSVGNNNNIMKTKTQVFTKPLPNDAISKQIFRSAVPKVTNKNLIIENKIKVSPFQNRVIQINKEANIIRSDVQPHSHLKQIQTLQSQLTQSLSDKLSLQMELNKFINSNKNLQFQIKSLKNQLLFVNQNRERDNNTTQQNHSDTIIQLLSQYQEAKRIIEKLMEDNEHISLRNQQLLSQQLQYNRIIVQNQNLQHLMSSFEKQRTLLCRQINDLKVDLKKYKQNSNMYAKQILDDAEKHTQNTELVNLKQQVQDLKKCIATADNQLVQKNQIFRLEQSQKIQQLRNQLQQYALIVSNKDTQILSLTQQVQDIGNKLKQVLAEFKIFTEILQTQKFQLSKQYQNFKISAQAETIRLKKHIQKLTQNKVDSSTIPCENRVQISTPQKSIALESDIQIIPKNHFYLQSN